MQVYLPHSHSRIWQKGIKAKLGKKVLKIDKRGMVWTLHSALGKSVPYKCNLDWRQMWQKASTCNFLSGEGSIPSSLSWVLSLSNQEGLDHSLGCRSYSCLCRDQHVLAFKEQMPCLFLHHPEMSWLFIMEKRAIHAHYVSSHPHQFTSPLASVGFIFILKGFCEHLHSQFSSVQSLSCVWLFATPWTAACQASLSITNPWSLLRLMSIKSVMPSNHLILCRPLLLPPSIFPSIRVFSNESVLHIRCPKYWSFSFSISPSNEYSGLISFRMDWLDLLAVQGTLKSFLHHSSNLYSSLQCNIDFWTRSIGWF